MSGIGREIQFYAYYRTTDNTIVEVPFITEHEGNSAHEFQAVSYGNAFGFHLLWISSQPWDNDEWNSGYDMLERRGYFTPERQEELFDTRIQEMPDRLDLDALDDDGYWH